MDDDRSDLIECPGCTMFVTPDTARCRFCDALVFSREQIGSNPRLMKAWLMDRVAALRLRGAVGPAAQDLEALAVEDGPLFYDALADIMMRGGERRFKSRVARALAVLLHAFEGDAGGRDVGPYRSGPAPESGRGRHLKLLNAALQRWLGVVCGDHAASELQILANLMTHDEVDAYRRLLLLDYACYLCASREKGHAPYLGDLDGLFRGLADRDLLEATQAAAYHRIVEAKQPLLRLFGQRDDLELMKAITRYLERVDARDEALVEEVVEVIHRRLEQENVPELLWHLNYLLTMVPDRRTVARPVLDEINARGSTKQIDWAKQQYRRALLHKIEHYIT